MMKGYKIRIYPTKKQEQLLWKHINCCRYIYNWLISKQRETYLLHQTHLSQFQMILSLTPLIHSDDHKWLQEVSMSSLQRVCADVHMAYQCFLSGKSHLPRFKSKKKAKSAFPINSANFYLKTDKYLHIEKIGKIRYKTDFILPLGTKQHFKNVRCSYIAGKWIISFSVECENQALGQLQNYTMGIDLGIHKAAVLAYDTDGKMVVFPNINKSRKIKQLLYKLKYLQRSISRKYEYNKRGKKYVKTHNIYRLEERVRCLYRKISNIRCNYAHQCTHQIVSLNPTKIIMEDLNIYALAKNNTDAQNIYAANWAEWIRQVRYKCEWLGIQFEQVSQWYPSSKTCHNCGHIKKDLKRGDRIYKCSICGYVEDRDYNAALNLKDYKGPNI